MSLVILATGIVGLGVALYGFVALSVDAHRHRHYWDIVIAIVVAIAVVGALIALGDRLLQ